VPVRNDTLEGTAVKVGKLTGTKLQGLPRQNWLKAAAAANAAAAMSSLSATESPARKISYSKHVPGDMARRFADIVKQVSTPSWLSGISPAQRQATLPAADITPSTMSTASDLVDLIDARLSGAQPPANEFSFGSIPSLDRRRDSELDFTASTGRRNSGTTGSAEIAQIEDIFRSVAMPSDQASSNASARHDASDVVNKANAPRRQDYEIFSSSAQISSHTSKPADRLHQTNSSSQLQPVEQVPSASQPPRIQKQERLSGVPATDNDGPLPHPQPKIRPTAPAHTAPTQSGLIMQMLRHGYLEPPLLAPLQSRWAHWPNVSASLFSLPGLR
jgi:hypothetical protein